MGHICFKRQRFLPDVIRNAVWLYACFTLSYRGVDDLLAGRGLDISYETVRRWFLKFGTPIARNLHRMRPTPTDYWYLDEMVIIIRRRHHWLWRAVDSEGEVLEFLAQSKRNARAALKLMQKLLKKHESAPTRITIDKFKSYHVAIPNLGLTAEHIYKEHANINAETAAFRITEIRSTIPEYPIRCVQRLLRSTSFAQQTYVQAISNRGVQRMGKRGGDKLIDCRCSYLQLLPINVTMLARFVPITGVVIFVARQWYLARKSANGKKENRNPNNNEKLNTNVFVTYSSLFPYRFFFPALEPESISKSAHNNEKNRKPSKTREKQRCYHRLMISAFDDRCATGKVL